MAVLISVLCGTFLPLRAFTAAGPPEFGEPLGITRDIFRIQSTNAGLHTPWVTDWDLDGDNDLLVGDERGRMRICTNIGTVTSPRFENGPWLQNTSGIIDVGDWAAPVHFDWNSDGKRDLLVGDGNGYVHVYTNNGTDGSPLFDDGERVQAAYGYLYVGEIAQPFVVDWNNDTAHDLVVNSGYGITNLFLNVGSASSPQLGYGVVVTAGGDPIQMPGWPLRPWVTDWDGDGRKDLLTTADQPGSPVLYVNIGTDAAPVFDGGEILWGYQAPVVLPQEMGWAFGDLNGDANEDFIVGDFYGDFTYYPNKGGNTSRRYEEAWYLPEGVPRPLFQEAKAPGVVDWDEDGRKDLILNAGLAWGRQYVVFNSGTDEAPLFDHHLILTSESGAKIGSRGNYQAPRVIDWNNDGKKDLLTSNKEQPGIIYLYLNQGENHAPAFAAPVNLAGGYLDLSAHHIHGVNVGDWDRDGKKDLFFASDATAMWGYFNYVYLNEGTDAVPQFNTGSYLTVWTGGYETALAGAEFNCALMWDYEEDGDQDLLVPTDQAWEKLGQFINSGSASFPHLEDGGLVQGPSGPITSQCRMQATVADWNEDGRKDLLVSNCPGLLVYPNEQLQVTSPHEVLNLVVSAATVDAVHLTWSPPQDCDLAGVLIVRSESPIDWRPSDRQEYHVIPGTKVAPDVEVVFKGDEDHSLTPWVDTGLVPGTTYRYRLFTFDQILPAYSMHGNEVQAETAAPSPTSSPEPTGTPEPTVTNSPVPPTAPPSPTVTPAYTSAPTVTPTAAPIPVVSSAGVLVLMLALGGLVGMAHRRR
ncbi:VCBS repeat-containing protein [bacterium]|nr:VCBS repeat-containing protein [candidate division CSSED10-310 bacterium]